MRAGAAITPASFPGPESSTSATHGTQTCWISEPSAISKRRPRAVMTCACGQDRSGYGLSTKAAVHLETYATSRRRANARQRRVTMTRTRPAAAESALRQVQRCLRSTATPLRHHRVTVKRFTSSAPRRGDSCNMCNVPSGRSHGPHWLSVGGRSPGRRDRRRPPPRP